MKEENDFENAVYLIQKREFTKLLLKWIIFILLAISIYKLVLK